MLRTKTTPEPIEVTITMFIHAEAQYEHGHVKKIDWEIVDGDPNYAWLRSFLPNQLKKDIEETIEETLEDVEYDEDDEDGHSDENHDYPDPVHICEK